MASTTEALRTVAEELAAAERERDGAIARAEQAERERDEARAAIRRAERLFVAIRMFGKSPSREGLDQIITTLRRASRESGGEGE